MRIKTYANKHQNENLVGHGRIYKLPRKEYNHVHRLRGNAPFTGGLSVFLVLAVAGVPSC